MTVLPEVPAEDPARSYAIGCRCSQDHSGAEVATDTAEPMRSRWDGAFYIDA